jgi:hypothetical protein
VVHGEELPPPELEFELELAPLVELSCAGSIHCNGMPFFGGQTFAGSDGSSLTGMAPELDWEEISVQNPASARGPQSAKAKPSQTATTNSARKLQRSTAV